MHITKLPKTRVAFLVFDVLFLSVSALLCLLPLVNMIAISFSSGFAAAAGYVKLWPVDFTFDSYKFIISNSVFWTSFWVSIKRIAIALPLTLFINVITSYPMSKDKRSMPGRSFYTYFLIIPMIFSGGLIPWYLTVRGLHLNNSIWGLVIPGLVQIFNIILLMNFFRNLPKEIEDAAFIDGAGVMIALFRIFIPLSKPCLATITLFIVVGHWNSWFDGIILMDSTKMYPLQTYLQSLLVQVDPRKMTSMDVASMRSVSNRTFRAAQILVASLPILAAYPFLQKYFTKGIVLGSVKG